MADVFAAVKPFLTAAKYFGLAPFNVDANGKKLKVFAPGLVYSAISLVAFTANAGFLTYAKLVYKDKRIDSYVGLASDMILLSSGIVVTLCCIFLTILQRRKYIRVVHDFHSVGFDVAKLDERIPYDSVLRWSRFILFILFVLLGLLFLHTAFYFRNSSTFLYVSYVYAWFAPKIYNFLMESQFVSGVLLLKIHFDVLNGSLAKIKDSRKAGKISNLEILDVATIKYAWMEDWKSRIGERFASEPFRTRKMLARENEMTFANVEPVDLEKIKRIRKIHGNLCEIKEYLNSSFSLQILTSVAQSFIFITANLYMIFTTVSKAAATISPLTLSHPILWFVTHTVELVIIVLTCTNTSKAANYTAVLVHKLLAKECRPELRNQLKLFSIQLLHRKVSFTASGFFNLDMTLLQSVIGAATTYLVILIQFHNSYEVPRN